jgi:FkbM family methyltransferase
MTIGSRFNVFAGRPLGSIGKALAKSENYSGFLRVFAQCRAPVDFLKRYITGSGHYPYQARIRTPIGVVTANAYCSDDVRTINEIFFRGDYGTAKGDRVVVDFGSNIGISALFFLSRNAGSFVYCHEPLPQNIGHLKANLQPFEGRYDLREAAVGLEEGMVSFGWEPTGRYGGIGKQGLSSISVPALDSNQVLRDIIAKHGRIDLLKIDIETLEYELTARIPPNLAGKIGRIVIELPFEHNPLPDTHDMTYRKPITTLHRRTD